jgi:seryl-tRNA synthetase
MLDTQFVIANPEVVKAAIVNKGVRGVTPADVDTIVSLSSSIKSQTTEIQKLRAERNIHSEKITQAKTPEEKNKIIEAGRVLKEKIAVLEQKLTEDEATCFRLLSFLPGIPSKDTPIGADSTGNIEHHQWGQKQKFDFEPKNHYDLLSSLGMLDLERGVKVAGFRGYFLKGDGAMLEWAVLMYAVKKLRNKGFEIITPPILDKEFTMFGSGQFPWSEKEIYEVGKPGLDETGSEIRDVVTLAGTAEQPLMGMYSNETLDLTQGPLKMAGLSPCFRSEVGSYSKDLRGIYRVHEFLKVEQVVLMEPDDTKADAMLTEILSNAEEILQDLGIHYRVLSMCTGDMGEPQHKKFDIESWMPGKGDYGETHSASNMRDFQTRRNNITVKLADGTKVFAYALNNTAIALPRFLIALVEQNQTKDGKIKVPKVLQPFMGKEIIG